MARRSVRPDVVQVRPARPIGQMQQSTAVAEPAAPAIGQGIAPPRGGYSYMGGNNAVPGGTIDVPDTRPAQTWVEANTHLRQTVRAPVGADEEAGPFRQPG